MRRAELRQPHLTLIGLRLQAPQPQRGFLLATMPRQRCKVRRVTPRMAASSTKLAATAGPASASAGVAVMRWSRERSERLIGSPCCTRRARLARSRWRSLWASWAGSSFMLSGPESTHGHGAEVGHLEHQLYTWSIRAPGAACVSVHSSAPACGSQRSSAEGLIKKSGTRKNCVCMEFAWWGADPRTRLISKRESPVSWRTFEMPKRTRALHRLLTLTLACPRHARTRGATVV
jgi:hypothetical protein